MVCNTCIMCSKGYFSPKQQSTIGAFFLTKKIQLPDGTNCKMQLWDTAGQERFRAMAPVRYIYVYIYKRYFIYLMVISFLFCCLVYDDLHVLLMKCICGAVCGADVLSKCSCGYRVL